jgi:DUF2911 family protein
MLPRRILVPARTPLMVSALLAASFLALLAPLAASLGAQQASFVYRLGVDTVAIDQFTRTPTRVTGELINRGAAVARVQYDVTLGADGRPTSATYRVLQADGTPITGRPTEIRASFFRDSVKRELVWPESTQVAVSAAPNPVLGAFPAWGLAEATFAQMRRTKAPSATVSTVGASAAPPAPATFTVGAGDTITTISPAGRFIFRVAPDGKLLAFDATESTVKYTATRGPGGLDLAAIAKSLVPLGVVSGRATARASFGGGPLVLVDYGRPHVRGRTVWGGLLIPVDSVWRAGANEATHLVTTNELTFGSLVVPPGTYTLWVVQTRTGPQLIINKQFGQWGAGPGTYDPAKDLGRVPMTLAAAPAPVEELTYTVRNLGGGRGALDLAWGPSVATASFTLKR